MVIHNTGRYWIITVLRLMLIQLIKLTRREQVMVNQQRRVKINNNAYVVVSISNTDHLSIRDQEVSVNTCYTE